MGENSSTHVVPGLGRDLFLSLLRLDQLRFDLLWELDAAAVRPRPPQPLT